MKTDKLYFKLLSDLSYGGQVTTLQEKLCCSPPTRGLTYCHCHVVRKQPTQNKVVFYVFPIENFKVVVKALSLS